MSAYVLRRSLLSVGVLAAFLAGAGAVLVVLGVPVWVPAVGAVALVGTEYAISPRLVEWLIPANVVDRHGDRYVTEHRIGDIVAQRCRQSSVPLVKLGIIDDGTPNAFSFGHTRRDARIWVSRGLLERLNDDELDAVVCHEIGHVANRDFVVMTAAAAVPMILYYLYLGARVSRRAHSILVVIGAYAGFFVSQLAVLALARAREYGADHHSCAVTGNGDAMASALVKVAYGMGQIDANRAAQARELRESAKDKSSSEKRAAHEEAAQVARQGHRMLAARMLGIADPSQGAAMVVACEEGMAADEVMGAMRWELCNPWGRFQEKLSSHPIVVRRIAALERSGLAGAPTHWSATRVEGACDRAELRGARRRFLPELVLRYTGPALLIVAVLAEEVHDWRVVAWSLLAGGLAMVARTMYRDPLTAPEPVDRVTSLLTRLDASPIRGLPVSVRGRVIGRGTPGYVLSPDLVVQDQSGFVPVLYRQPFPGARSFFATLRAGRYADQEVLVHGWYRRGPAPVLELRDITAADGTTSRSRQWVAAYLLSVAILLPGLLMVAWFVSA
ncbi:MAG: M48 family metalloprotease [Acidimicrobiales bacterium]